MTIRPPTRNAGFTLIEMVISGALMAILLAGAYVCLSSGLSSQRLIDSRAGLAQSGRVALGMIAADLRAACPLTKDNAFVGMSRSIDDVQADNLDFATHNFTPRRPGQADWCEVSYFVGRSRSSPGLSLWRRRDPTPDDDPFGGGLREELVTGLRGLHFEFYDGWDWYDEWGDVDGRGKLKGSLIDHPNWQGMPEAVRITIMLEPNSRSARKADSTEPREPPLVFQTICRLNLAGLSSDDGLTGSPDSGNDKQPDTAPDGGTE